MFRFSLSERGCRCSFHYYKNTYIITTLLLLMVQSMGIKGCQFLWSWQRGFYAPQKTNKNTNSYTSYPELIKTWHQYNLFNIRPYTAEHHPRSNQAFWETVQCSTKDWSFIIETVVSQLGSLAVGSFSLYLVQEWHLQYIPFFIITH